MKTIRNPHRNQHNVEYYILSTYDEFKRMSSIVSQSQCGGNFSQMNLNVIEQGWLDTQP